MFSRIEDHVSLTWICQFHLMGRYRIWESSCNITLHISAHSKTKHTFEPTISYEYRLVYTIVKGNHSPFKLFNTNSTFSPAFQFLSIISFLQLYNLMCLIPSHKFSIRFKLLKTHYIHSMLFHDWYYFRSNSD